MDKQIIIDDITYNNYVEKEPDFKNGDLNNFKMYYKIFLEDFDKLKMNTLISYNIENKIYNTGFILKFIEPNIFILKDIELLYIWSIRIDEDTTVFVKDISLFRKENKIKNILFERYKNEN